VLRSLFPRNSMERGMIHIALDVAGYLRSQVMLKRLLLGILYCETWLLKRLLQTTELSEINEFSL